MISFSPIGAIALRHLRIYKGNLNLLLALLFWPVLDIITWGYLGAWVQQSGMSHFYNYETIALLGVLLWQVVGRGANVVAYSFNEELWSNNILNLFGLPLRLIEWSLGTILYFSLMMAATALSSMLVIYLLYDTSVWAIFYNFMLFMPPLFLSAIWLGFTCLQIVLLFGKRGVELGFVLVWFLLPFSGAYYPIDVLPAWGQTISAFLPMSYVLTGMRSYVVNQQSPIRYLTVGYGLSILYAVSAVGLFMYLFNWSKQKGLARLMD